MGFNFERNLPHQERAVEAVIDVFIEMLIRKRSNSMSNHLFEKEEELINNIREVQIRNNIIGNEPEINKNFWIYVNILDTKKLNRFWSGIHS